MDKLCFWTAALVAFWGSMRLGELFCKRTKTFSPASDMLGTDVLHMSTTSFALWIRDPKVPKPYGDVIEIWETHQFPDLDPYHMMATYWESRKNKDHVNQGA